MKKFKYFVTAIVLLLVPLMVKADTGVSLKINNQSKYDKKTNIVSFVVDAENQIYSDKDLSEIRAGGIIKYDPSVLEFVESNKTIKSNNNGTITFEMDYSTSTADGYPRALGEFQFKVIDKKAKITTLTLDSLSEPEEGCYYIGCVEGNNKFTVDLESDIEESVEPKDLNRTTATTSESNNMNDYIMYVSLGVNGILFIALIVILIKRKK